MQTLHKLRMWCVLPAAALFIPMDVQRDPQNGLPVLKANDACALASCAPKPKWECIIPDIGGAVIREDRCDPNDYGCLE